MGTSTEDRHVDFPKRLLLALRPLLLWVLTCETQADDVDDFAVSPLGDGLPA